MTGPAEVGVGPDGPDGGGGPEEGGARFTARSVLASALLGEDPPELPVSHLVHLSGLFGISGNRARVALSRMVASGEVTTDGSGRYRLTGHLLERQARQRAGLVGDTRPWQGGWRLVVVTGPGRSAGRRSERRRRLLLARLAEQREGVWLRPDNLDLHPDPSGDPDLAVYSGVPDADPVRLAAQLWDLAGWAARAEQLRGRLETTVTSGPDDLAPGFALSAAVIRHLLADPLLPAELLGRSWPGPALREAYGRWDRDYRRVLRAWGRTTGPA